MTTEERLEKEMREGGADDMMIWEAIGALLDAEDMA